MQNSHCLFQIIIHALLPDMAVTFYTPTKVISKLLPNRSFYKTQLVISLGHVIKQKNRQVQFVFCLLSSHCVLSPVILLVPGATHDSKQKAKYTVRLTDFLKAKK